MTRPAKFAVLLDSSSDDESAEEEEEVVVKQPVASPPMHKPGDFVVISSEEYAFPHKVIKVGDHQFEGQLLIARIDSDFHDKGVGFWTAAESLMKVEASDPRVANLGAKTGKKKRGRKLRK